MTCPRLLGKLESNRVGRKELLARKSACVVSLTKKLHEFGEWRLLLISRARRTTRRMLKERRQVAETSMASWAGEQPKIARSIPGVFVNVADQVLSTFRDDELRPLWAHGRRSVQFDRADARWASVTLEMTKHCCNVVEVLAAS